MRKTLILGTCYISEGTEGAQNYGARLVNLWAELAHKLNPETDILLIDSASPVDVFSLAGTSRCGIFQFQDNVGHINTTGVDGFGRAFCYGVELAIDGGYDYLAYIDADIVFTRPVGPIIQKMARSGVKAACPMDTQYNFLENGLMFLDVAYLRDTKFVERYDWPSRKPTTDPSEIPEMVFEKLLEDVIFTLPLRGFRNDFDRITANNLEGFAPYGIDYLTHCKDFAVYGRLLEMKGIEL